MQSLKEVMRGNLLVFTIGDVLRQLSMFITFPFFSLYVVALGGSMVDIGIVNSLRPLTGLFLYPVAGYISDRYSKVKIIGYTGILSAVLWSIFIFARDWRWIAVGNFLLGLMTFYFPASNALMASSIPEDKRALGYSLWLAIPRAVGIFSPLAGGYLISVWGITTSMRFLYILTFFVGLFIAFMNMRYLEEPPVKEIRDSRNLFGVLKESYKGMFEMLKWLPSNLRAFGIMLVLGFLLNNMVSSYWVIYATQSLGLSAVQWGIVLLVAAVINVVLMVPAGMLVDRLGPKRVLTWALLIGAVPMLLFRYATTLVYVAVLLVIMTIANSFLMSGAPAYMTHSVPPERRGQVMSALGMGMLFINTRGGGGGGPGMGTLLTIPSIIGAILGGFVYGYNPNLLWLSFGVVLLISAIMSDKFL
ncbi:MFS transporter [Candidatus Bathyarchaeota archaeon]|jgi:MFS family permease|nr:MFS transporter [Candidatus Bathyarchaeota archaeon]MBT4320158.1 MFS transporter [Candidatus Bathyarchaeota archaeon]MBT4424788.1 MFS transporter [Candidatus Bathyarchaeota archaeon]MBT6604765.1 MFS transporter [Candidatus Bathyarchaeota archaeon]MBT7188001.1 MFS transporter [Candidatus Bathyarchaeota archaeon]